LNSIVPELDDVKKSVPRTVRGLLWVGCLFLTLGVWPVFVGCERQAQAEDVDSKLVKALDATQVWGFSTGPVASHGSHFADVEFSRYGSVAFSTIIVSMTDEQRLILGKELGLSEQALSDRFSASEQVGGGYRVSIDSKEGWVETLRGSPIYEVTVSRRIGLLTPYEWLLTLD
jgi:hypothetical protein